MTPATDPPSTPTLLKAGDRRQLGKPRKITPPKDKQSTKTTPAKKVANTRVKKTPEERKEYELTRSQTPERKEYQRKLRRRITQAAERSSKCVICPNQAIEHQTKRETCAERHRQSGRRNRENQKAATLAT